MPFELAKNRLNAPLARLDDGDLSAYDVILCTDLEVLAQVRARMSAVSYEGDDSRVLSLCDFLACGDDRMDALDEELRELVSPLYSQLVSMLELPDAYPSQPERWNLLLAASVLSCASLTSFMKECFNECERRTRRAPHIESTGASVPAPTDAACALHD